MKKTEYLTFEMSTGREFYTPCEVLSATLPDPLGKVDGRGFIIRYKDTPTWVHETRIRIVEVKEEDNGKSSGKPAKGKGRSV